MFPASCIAAVTLQADFLSLLRISGVIIVVINMHMVGDHHTTSDGDALYASYHRFLVNGGVASDLNPSVTLRFQLADDHAGISDLDQAGALRDAA